MDDRLRSQAGLLATIINEFRRSIGVRREDFRGAKIDVFTGEPDPRQHLCYTARTVRVRSFEEARAFCISQGLSDHPDRSKTWTRMQKILRRALNDPRSQMPAGLARFEDVEFY